MDRDIRHFRHLLLFFFDQNVSVYEACQLLNQTYRESAPVINTCKLWFRKFECGNFDVKVVHRGLTKKLKHEKVQKIFDENPNILQQEVAKKVNVAQSTISLNLRTIRNCQTVQKSMNLTFFMRRKFKEMQDLIDTNPNLSQKQMATKLDVSESSISRLLQYMRKSQTVGKDMDLVSHIQCYSCISLLSRHKNQGRFLDKVVTGGEIAVSYYTPNHTEANTSNENKLTLYIWWNTKGVICYELLPSHESPLNQYSQQLKNLKQALKDSEQPQKANKNRKVILLHSFFAEINILKSVKEQILEYGWEVLPYPATSFDVTPSKCHLLPRIRDAFKNQHFRTFKEVETSVGVRINTINNSQAIINDCGISSLPEIWEKCIETKGNFVTEV